MNTLLTVSRAGPRMLFGEGQSVEATGPFAPLGDGRYLAGFRASHLTIARKSPAALEFRTTVSVTEITGSESFLHLHHGTDRWVGLVHGVHDLAAGSALTVYLDPAHVYLFAEDGALVAPAAYAMAA